MWRQGAAWSTQKHSYCLRRSARFQQENNVCVTGLREVRPAVADLFWDADKPHGSIYKLWGLDVLHHVDLGIAKRLGAEQLKVLSAKIYSDLSWIHSHEVIHAATHKAASICSQYAMQGILAYTAAADPAKYTKDSKRFFQTWSDKFSQANSRYNIARVMIIPPFARPPAPRGGHLVDKDRDGFGKLKASELGRLLRTLPFIVESIRGSETSNAVLSLIR